MKFQPSEIIYSKLYDKMHAALIANCRAHPCEKEEAEAGFWIASGFCDQVISAAKSQLFATDAEEIRFFRLVKPLFSSRAEYFIRICEALVCVPPEPLIACAFWEEESSRISWYRNKHERFISYYETGCSSEDPLYFLRRNNTHVPDILPPYDKDPAMRCSHDNVLAAYLALKDYQLFVKKKLALFRQVK